MRSTACAIASASSTSTTSPFTPSLDDLRRLPDPRRDERDAGRHRLEHALRAALLPRGDDVRRRARGTRARARRDRRASTCRYGIPSRSSSRADVAARRSRQQHVERRRPRPRRRSSAATSTSGPLTSFGSSPSPQPTPSFWNEPTTNASRGQAERRPRRRRGARRRRAGSARGRSRSGSRAPRAGSTPAASDEVAHLGVRHLDRGEAIRGRARASRTRGRTPGSPGVPGRPCRYAVAEPVRRLEPAGLQRLEVAREEDGLVARRTAPSPTARPRSPSRRAVASRWRASSSTDQLVRSPTAKSRECVGQPRVRARTSPRARCAPGAPTSERAVIRAAPRGSDPRRPRAASRGSPHGARRAPRRAGRVPPATSSGSSNGTPASPTSSGCPPLARKTAGSPLASASSERVRARVVAARGEVDVAPPQLVRQRLRRDRAEHAHVLEDLVGTARERQLVALVVEMRVEPREDVGALVRDCPTSSTR